MDALTRVACYFPARAITTFWIVSNIVISNQGSNVQISVNQSQINVNAQNDICNGQSQGLIIAIIIIFCIFVLMTTFTDTYTASNKMSYAVLLLPFYGPVCFSLPSDADKDKVYDHYYLHVRDYIRAVASMTAFLLIVLFINPIAPCLFPSSSTAGVSSLDPAVVRTVPVVVAIVTALLMMCLGPSRQCLGFQNVEETCPILDNQVGGNPIFTPPRVSHAGYMAEQRSSHQSYPLPPSSIPEGDPDAFDPGMPMGGYPGPPSYHAGVGHSAGSLQRGSRGTYPQRTTPSGQASVRVPDAHMSMRASDQHSVEGAAQWKGMPRQN